MGSRRSAHPATRPCRVREITGHGDRQRFDGNGDCFVEADGGKAGFGCDNFYAELTPQVALHPVGRRWHLTKPAYEKNWLRRWF